jgi:hypothetical protein
MSTTGFLCDIGVGLGVEAGDRAPVFMSLHHYNIWGAVWDITGGLGGRRGAPENPS